MTGGTRVEAATRRASMIALAISGETLARSPVQGMHLLPLRLNSRAKLVEPLEREVPEPRYREQRCDN
jgi:hypothetical protein